MRVLILLCVGISFPALATDTLRTQGFGGLFSLVVDGQIYAQPLVVSNLEMPGKGRRNVVYIATMRNNVYAYDADGIDSAPFWSEPLGPAMPYDRIPKDAGALLKGMMGNMGMPGGFLSISANGAKDGILWRAIPYQDDAWVEIVRGSMRAFRADTLELLWSTDGNDPTDNFDFGKNVPPTVANGKVYPATFSDRLNVYGLHSPLAATPCPRYRRTRATGGT
jgi:outer membrane protein assembly factor BamB